MRLIKVIVGVILVFCIGWSAWWYLGARAQESGFEAWLAEQRSRGWQAEAASVEVTGFPARFELAAAELALADPANGWAWSAPLLLAESDSWSPTRIAVTFPPEQTLSSPSERATVRSDVMTTLLDVRPGTDLQLREASGRIAGLTVESSAGWTAATADASVRLAERPEDLAPPNSYDLTIDANAVRLPKELVDRIDPTGWLEPSVDTVTVAGHFALADPIDLETLETGQVALRAATIREAGFAWGDMGLVVTGSFEVDEQGYPDGAIEIEAREWRQMVRLAVSSGVIDAGTGEAVTRAVELITALTGSGDTISAPLNLSGGKVRIGPFAVADAPRLAPPRG